ncbi:MAG TPA: hypothetical protein VNQ79_19650 [Blastocatellia bacterium]|nr:hypothetical protein [Blastocatellia bacterium]
MYWRRTLLSVVFLYALICQPAVTVTGQQAARVKVSSGSSAAKAQRGSEHSEPQSLLLFGVLALLGATVLRVRLNGKTEAQPRTVTRRSGPLTSNQSFNPSR